MKLIVVVFGIVLQSLVSGSVACALAAELQLQPEYLRTGPEGEIVPADRAAAGEPRALSLAGARRGYVSLQVIAALRGRRFGGDTRRIPPALPGASAPAADARRPSPALPDAPAHAA